MTDMAVQSTVPRISQWDDEVEAIISGDLAAAAAYVTPLGGAVVTAVAPCGLASRRDGTVGFTTSLGFAKKLERVVREPRVSLAYHTREHGFATQASFVLVQGVASIDPTPSQERLEAFIPQAERFLGPVKRGAVWDRILHEYYYERVFVDIQVERILAWDNLAAAGAPACIGAPPVEAEPGAQAPPARGTAPRVDCDRLVAQLSRLPHRLLAYQGVDGFPVVTPFDLAGHDEGGITLVSSAALSPGGRRAGLLAHAFRPQLIGLSARNATGWLDVDDQRVCYAPHTSKGFVALPSKTLLLTANGLLAKFGLRSARRRGLADALLAAQSHDAPDETTNQRRRLR